MRITPLDVRKQEFRRSVRGFDCDEVRAFMSTLADEYEIVLVDNKQLREKLMSQEDKIGEYQTMERTLRDTLMTAEKLMQETRENARKEGELIIQDSRLKAKEILQECRLRTEELRREINGLRKEKEAYLGRFKSLAESQIHFIESHRHDFRDLDARLTAIVDSVADGIAQNAERAESEAVVDTIVEALIHPDVATEREVATAQPGAAPKARSEEDIWRNYNPASSHAPQRDSASAGVWNGGAGERNPLHRGPETTVHNVPAHEGPQHLPQAQPEAQVEYGPHPENHRQPQDASHGEPKNEHENTHQNDYDSIRI